MPNFGEKLREERERRNTAIEEIAGTTKIQLSYLEALEQNEFDALPGPAFGKLYIRAYAEVLGFDPRPLIDDYDRERQNRGRRESSRSRAKQPEPMTPEDRARVRQERFAKVVGAERSRPRPQELPPDRVAVTSHEVESREPVEATMSVPDHHEEDDALETAVVVDTEDAAASGEPEPGEPTEERDLGDSSVTSVAAPGPALAADSTAEPVPSRPANTRAGAMSDAAGAVDIAGVEFDDRRSKRRSSFGLTVAVVAATVLLVVIVWVSLSDRPREGQPVAPGVAETAEPADVVIENAETLTAMPETGQISGDARDAAADRSSAATPPPQPVPVPQDNAVVAPSSAHLTVSEFGVGRRVVNHRLEGRGDRFEEGSVVWFSTRVLGGTSGERIRHVWFRGGEAVQSIGLPLGGPHWRTHSQKTLWGTGRWSVEARDESGTVLARAEFSCVP